MKTNLKIFISFLVFSLIAFGSLSAQTTTSNGQGDQSANAYFDIQFNGDFTLTLTKGLTESGTYVGNVSQFESDMPDQQTADLFMDQFEREHVNITVNLQSLKAMVALELNETTSSWSMQQWNDHLKSN